MPSVCVLQTRKFFDRFFNVNKLKLWNGIAYLLLGLMSGYVYRNIPIRIECDIWTNFILDPYKISYAHAGLAIIILHSFNGFGKYIFLPGLSTNYSNRTSQFTHMTETFYFLTISYPVPLFLLTLYYNYGYDYGITGLHLVYPLVAVVPYLLSKHKSRDLLDLIQCVTGISSICVGCICKNGYAVIAFVIQAIAYYFNHIRGYQYKRFGSERCYNMALVLTVWFMYMGMLQSCVDNGGDIDTDRVKEILTQSTWCEDQGCLRSNP